MSEPLKTCGQCSHYAPHSGMTKGLCYLNPPTTFASGDRQRPPVAASDRQCSFFKEGIPVAKEKLNPETPGLAAKVAGAAKKK